MSTEVKLPKEKLVTQPLYRWLTLVLGPSHNPISQELHPTDALIVYHQDPDEEFCHVEFPDSDNKLKAPRIWWIGPWRADYNRVLKQKQDSAAQRLEANKRDENAQRMARQLVKMTGIDYNQAYATCMRCAVKKDTNAAEALKTKLDL